MHHVDSFGITLKGRHNVVRNNILTFCCGSGFNRRFKGQAKDYEAGEMSISS